MANSPRCVCIWYRVKSVNILFVFNLWISDWIHVYIYILLDDYMIQNIDIHYRFPHPLRSNTSATFSISFMPPPPAFLGGPNCSRHKQNTPWLPPHLRQGFRSHHQSLAVVFFRKHVGLRNPTLSILGLINWVEHLARSWILRWLLA